MRDKNVYDKARGAVRELQPLLHAIREEDKSLAEQLKRAAQSSDWGYIEAQRATHLDERLDEVCAITWSPARTSLAEPHADANRALAVPASFPSASAMLRTTLFIARWIWSQSDRSRLRTIGRTCRSRPAA